MFWRANFLIIGLVLRISSVSPIDEIISEDEVQHLIGEPDFRDVLLHWEYGSENEEKAPKVLAFQIHYCEVQAWGQYRCRNKVLDTASLDKSEKNATNISTTPVTPFTRQGRTYATRITGLRMATTYSFEVRPVKRDARDLADPFSISFKNIIVPTKGFSARATQCLPHASEVEVSTGPYFGGRIAVEAANGGAERCSIQGNPNSAQDAYILRINHTECGSVVNDTTVATYVLVQENLPILTHSTRRFLVLCTYKPETLTVRAGINLPRSEVVRNVKIGSVEPFSIDDEDDSEDVEYNEVRASRLQAETEQADLQGSGQYGAVAVVMLMVVIVFIAIALLIWKVTPMKDNDNVSIVTASSLSRLGIFRKNRDKFSDNFSIYSISLSEKDGFPKKESDGDNTSEA